MQVRISWTPRVPRVPRSLRVGILCCTRPPSPALSTASPHFWVGSLRPLGPGARFPRGISSFWLRQVVQLGCGRETFKRSSEGQVQLGGGGLRSQVWKKGLFRCAVEMTSAVSKSKGEERHSGALWPEDRPEVSSARLLAPGPGCVTWSLQLTLSGLCIRLGRQATPASQTPPGTLTIPPCKEAGAHT